MTYERVMNSIGLEGKPIMYMLLRLSTRNDVSFQNTEVGFVVCVMTDRGPVKLVQVWGQMEGFENGRMETRQQMYPDFLGMSESDRKDLAMMLKNAYFTEAGEGYSNVKLSFGDRSKLIFDQEKINSIESALVQAIKFVKEKGKVW